MILIELLKGICSKYIKAFFFERTLEIILIKIGYTTIQLTCKDNQKEKFALLGQSKGKLHAHVSGMR